MQLEFEKQKMTLAHMNIRSEVHGEDRREATDLKLHVLLQNDCLAMFHPYLKNALYHLDATHAKSDDLADKGMDSPHVRMPEIDWPMRWKGEMKGAKFVIRQVGVRENVSFADAKINGARITAKDGGIIDLTFRVQLYPDEAQFGRLATMVQKEVSVTIEPGEEEAASGE